MIFRREKENNKEGGYVKCGDCATCMQEIDLTFLCVFCITTMEERKEKKKKKKKKEI